MPKLLRLLRPSPVIALTDAATVATDASAGSHFRVTMTANRTLGAPTNPTDGQRCIWEILAGTAITPIVTTGSAGAFAFPANFSALPAVPSGSRLYVAAIYNQTADRWHVLSAVVGAF